jgi:hypothetical protein
MNAVNKFLLREYFALCPGGVCKDLLTEEEKRDIGHGAYYLTGILQAADIENGNHRVYPYKTLKREIDAYEKLVREHRAVGALDHPDSEVVELKEASHVVTRLWWDGKNVMGTLKILSTPNGKTLRALCEDKIQLGISSRSLGTLKEEGGVSMVEESLELICFDVVHEPSTPGAFLKPQMVTESMIRNIRGNFTKSDRLNRLMLKILEG